MVFLQIPTTYELLKLKFSCRTILQNSKGIHFKYKNLKGSDRSVYSGCYVVKLSKPSTKRGKLRKAKILKDLLSG